MLKPSRIANLEFIALIAMLMALVALAINMILPAFDDITQHFGLSTPTQIGLAVSLLYVGLAVGQIIFGALSDSTGRKMAMNVGLGVFIVGAAISWAASTFPILIIGQIIQGLGLGAPRVVTVAVVRDRFEGPKMARMMSFIMVVFALVPTVSPYIGQAIVTTLDWRALFSVFIGGAIITGVWFTVRMSETHLPLQRSAFSLRSILYNFAAVLCNGSAMIHAAALGVVSGAFIAYLNLSQQILQFQYELGTQYPLYFAVMSLSIVTASFINGRAVVAFGLKRLSTYGLTTMFGLSVILTTSTWFTNRDPNLIVLLAYLMAMLFCFGILVSNLNAMAMRSLGATAGTGAAVVGAFSTFISVPLAIRVGGHYEGSVMPLVGAFGLFSLIGLCLVFFGHLRDSGLDSQH